MNDVKTTKNGFDINVKQINNNVAAGVKALKIQGMTDSSYISENETSKKYADVIIDISHEKLDRPFQYIIPPELRDKISIGTCVEIPFGKGNRSRYGYVIATSDICSYDPKKLKSITSVTENLQGVDSARIKLADWMRERYGTTMIAALKTVLPIRKKIRSVVKKTIVIKISREECLSLIERYKKRHQEARIKLLKYRMDGNFELSTDMAKSEFGLTDSVIKALEKDGIINIVSENLYRDPIQYEVEDKKLTLTDQQKHTADSILKSYDEGKAGISLIHGITGSGKTEVYMEIIRGMQERGLKSILLIPEISLTYQNVSRFRARFKDKVCVLHSKLSQGERYDQWERARKGDTDIMIGPRSALFAPFENLGAIIIDEEHEGSYKSEQMPKYHAREVAAKIASLYGAVLVLGSATPSLETYNAAKEGRIDYYRLDKRATGAKLPNVDVIDLREELRNGNRSIFSRKLLELMADRLDKKEQIILFLNRRGYLGFISCKSCGFVVKCPHCDVSLTQHLDGKLVCHYCGYAEKMVTKCPECGSSYIYGFKSGTQQVEESIHKIFPKSKVMRIDGDTTKKKGSMDEMLQAFSNQEADILLGTQMIVKGHDFPKVSLVGILCADLSMFVPDYRAAERTFQLLTQAAGRAGRGDIPGDVIIQTYQPDHHGVRYAKEHDYESFYSEEIEYRKLLHYPPAGHLLEVMAVSSDEETNIAEANILVNFCNKLADENGISDKLSIIGPSKAALYKLDDKYRMVFYVKSNSIKIITAVMNALDAYINAYGNKTSVISFDVDPIR